MLETSCTHFELIYQFHEKMEEIREKFYAGNASATEAFEEMIARLAELEVSTKQTNLMCDIKQNSAIGIFSW